MGMALFVRRYITHQYRRKNENHKRQDFTFFLHNGCISSLSNVSLDIVNIRMGRNTIKNKHSFAKLVTLLFSLEESR
jgi:hypothetical protein